MTIKIEIPSDDKFKPLAVAIGQALVNYGRTQLDPASAAILSQVDANNSHPKAQTVDEQAVADLEKDSAGSAAGSSNLNQADSKTHAETQSATTRTETSSDADDADDIRVDLKGVEFNKDYCADAAEPFFKSGTNKGQWKKRVGVSKEKYDEWYAGQLAGLDDTEEPELPTHDKNGVAYDAGMCEQMLHPAGARAGTWINKSGIPMEAFDAWYNSQLPKQEQDENEPEFNSFGDLMAWVSAQQNAGNITQDDVDAAWKAIDLPLTQAVLPTNAHRLVEVYRELKG